MNLEIIGRLAVCLFGILFSFAGMLRCTSGEDHKFYLCKDCMRIGPILLLGYEYCDSDTQDCGARPEGIYQRYVLVSIPVTWMRFFMRVLGCTVEYGAGLESPV